MRKGLRLTAMAAGIAGVLSGAPAAAEGAPAGPAGDAPGVAVLPPPAPPATPELIGRTVVGRNGERLGEVADVLVDVRGNARILVVALDDTMVAGKQVGVDIKKGRVALRDDRIAVDGLTRADLAARPGVDEDEAMAAFERVSRGGGTWPAGLAPLPGWFAEPQPDVQ
ncbi:PRC-barrel domain-containing protein [Azospirillum sp. ST 5-10]|uniref:PRC-barrel domain-containing protein n=1 Tax=unclassified Azospirillum TaxID=2630922 RepID=UPI003F4A6F71